MPRRLPAAVLDGRAERGVLICGSGVGACVAANKIPGIRAAICHDGYSAHQGVEHDDMNVLVLGSRVIGPELAKDLVRELPARQLQRRGTPRSPLGKSEGHRSKVFALGALRIHSEGLNGRQNNSPPQLRRGGAWRRGG